MTELTQELVRELLDYNPETGIFTWKTRDRKHFPSDKSAAFWNIRHAGKKAGRTRVTATQRHINICILYNMVAAHRLAFLYMTGTIPNGDIDHINGITSDNSWKNLRAVSHQVNCRNMKLRKGSKTGITGVLEYKYKDTLKFMARIRAEGKDTYLGLFNTKEDAIAARQQANKQYDYHENHGRQL